MEKMKQKGNIKQRMIEKNLKVQQQLNNLYRKKESIEISIKNLECKLMNRKKALETQSFSESEK